jgi:hypothetical protein
MKKKPIAALIAALAISAVAYADAPRYTPIKVYVNGDNLTRTYLVGVTKIPKNIQIVQVKTEWVDDSNSGYVRTFAIDCPNKSYADAVDISPVGEWSYLSTNRELGLVAKVVCKKP